MTTSTPDPNPTVYWSLGRHLMQPRFAEARLSLDPQAGSRLLAMLKGDHLAELENDDAHFPLPQIAPERRPCPRYPGWGAFPC